MKTRIDVISGYYGAGKSELISRMLRTSALQNERIAVCYSKDSTPGMLANTLRQMIRQRCPGRILLETTGVTLLEDIPRLLGDVGLMETAFSGTFAFVMDGFAFLHEHDLLQDYYESQLTQASVVFINHIDGLDADEKLQVLSRIWEINRHIHLMVEPLYGIDLWRVIDLPRNECPNPHESNKPLPARPDNRNII